MIAEHFEAQQPVEIPPAPPQPRTQWTQHVDEALTDLDVSARLEMVERLALVNTQWSRSVLEAAREEERDAALRAAIDRALAP